jgi:hypothetical protein
MKNHYIGQEFVMQREIIADEIQQQAHMLDRILQAKALGPMSHSSFSRYSPWASYISLFSNKSHISHLTALGPMSHSTSL